MGTMATVRVNTTQRMILYRDFVIEEAYEPGKGNVWQWTHEKYDSVSYPVGGDCQTVFECIIAIDGWYSAREAA